MKSSKNGSRLKLNPMVSVFRHNAGIYLFDPITRTCCTMNESMMEIITKLENGTPFYEIFRNEDKDLKKITQHLQNLGILIEADVTDRPEQSVCSNIPETNIYLTIFVTTKCNLKCTYCYANGGDTEKTITRDIWQLAMDHYFSTICSISAQKSSQPKYASLAIHGGGEATVEFCILREIVSEFVERAHLAGMQPSITLGTNGTYNKNVSQWILENDIMVNISLDGPRNIHNRLRPFHSGQPSYDVVVKNLKELVNAGRQVSIRSTITEEALETMEETVRLAKKLKLAAVHFEPVSLTGRCTTTAPSKPDAERFSEKFLKSFLLGLKYDINVNFSGMRCFDSMQQKFCAACGQNFCITPDGNITTCYEVLDSNDPAANSFFIGKIDQKRGRVVFDQKRIKKLNLRTADNMSACKDCFMRYQCAGDCPAKSFRYSGQDLYTLDPYRCQIIKSINKQLIVWLAEGKIEPRNTKHTSIISLN